MVKLKMLMPEGKHQGKTLEEIIKIDEDYVIFLSQRDLNYIQKQKYKAFFDRIPDLVECAKSMTQNIPKNEKTPQVVKYPGGWKGW